MGVHPRDAWPTEEGRGADEHECMAWGASSALAGCPAVGEEEWKGKAMNHIGDGNEMVETPRTDEREARNGNVLCGSANLDFARQLERELQEAQERIRLLISERDSARQQADLNWKMREEFTALLGTDDVKEAVRELKRWKVQQISTTQTK